LKRALLSVSACFLLSAARPGVAQTSSTYEPLLKSLSWRNIGPAIMGGRIDDFAVVESNPSILYVGTAAGGVFKSVNKGTTWEAVFDNQTVSSIGDVTVAPSDPNVVWVGTGEANNRQSSSWGDGVYKSTDAGKTWTHMGLENTHHIGRIVIDPRDPNVVCVAAGGDLWGPSKDRGLYRSTDGGKTWTQTLFVNEDTGCSDLVVDLNNPDILYTSAYQRRRTAFGFNGGGLNSGIYKSTDAGATWKKCTNGLPTGQTGRIGLDIYRKDSKIVYACVENANGGIFRSEDQGETWKKMGTVNMSINAYRPAYFSQIRVDPKDDQHIWMAGVNMGVSNDGGKTFRPVGPAIHADVHAIWIDPNNPSQALVGCDGGIQWTYDAGRTWDYMNVLALAQFYEVHYDMRKPYWVYGGLQDNGSWGAPSSTLTARGPSNDEWINVGGGDGFYVQADPMDDKTIYSESQQGAVARLNVRTGERKSIRPRPEPGEPPYRFDWNTPILISSHDHTKLFVAGNRLFISNDRGDSWRRTEDLTTNSDRTKMTIMGLVPGKETMATNDGQDSFGQIVTVTESPVKAGVIYVGTDDGNLQVSRDDGKTWKNVVGNVAVPKGTYVTRVLASRFAEGRVYATFDGHRGADFKPYVFVSEDFGATWKSVSANLPVGGAVKAVREDPHTPDLLFVGTERGLWISFDRGASWVKPPSPLPTVPVNDIQVHPREHDLILGTHGRGVWVLDDITWMEQLAGQTNAPNAMLFDPRATVQFRTANTKAVTGSRIFTSPNAPNAAMFTYYLKSRPDGDVKITILDKTGRTVLRELTDLSSDPGLYRVLWDTRIAGQPTAAGPARPVVRPATTSEAAVTYTPTATEGATPGAQAGGGTAPGGANAPRRAGQAGTRRQGGPAGAGQVGGGGGGGRGGFGGPRGPRVLPGTYLVRLTAGKEEITKQIVVEDDPRIVMTDRDRKARYDMVLRVNGISANYNQARTTLTGLKTQFTTLAAAKELAAAPQPVKDHVATLNRRITALQTELAQGTKAPQPKDPGRTPVDAAEKPAETTPGQAATTPPTPGEFGPTIAPVQTNIFQVNNALDSITEPPSPAIRRQIETLNSQVSQVAREIAALQSREIPALNRDLEALKLKPIEAGQRIALVQTAKEMPVLVEMTEEEREAAGDDDADVDADEDK
jgi:photosystem II stability/assembly factor-like uncharacterized protein